VRLLFVFVPEYTITAATLASIASIEYARSIIENTVVLPVWQKQLAKDSLIKATKSALEIYGYNTSTELIKKFVNGIEKKTDTEVKNYINVRSYINQKSKSKEIDEQNLKELHAKVANGILPASKCKTYRSKKTESQIQPEEILAKTTELMDWYNGLDAQETHIVITAGILKAQLELIEPFELTNKLVSNLAVYLILSSRGYDMRGYLCLEEYYIQSRNRYDVAIMSITDTGGDITKWLEYFTEGFAHEVSKIKENIVLLAKDTKLAKVSGRSQLTERQEKIIEFLQDYGLLTNSGFQRLFPDISEDSVLRDLKTLADSGIVVKKGQTKSARYELK